MSYLSKGDKILQLTSNVLMTITLLFLHLQAPLKKPYAQETVPLRILKVRNGRKNTTNYS